MPRRSGCFQKALVVWFEANRSRFVIPARLKMVKGGRAAITLQGQPACLSITASPHNLGVWVSWQGVNWDALLDLDVLAVKTPDGFRCILCEDSPFKIWPSREALWADHLFEPFLKWVNESYAKTDAVLLFGRADSFTIVKLRQPDPLSGIAPINDPPAAAHSMLANAAQFDALAAIMPT